MTDIKTAPEADPPVPDEAPVAVATPAPRRRKGEWLVFAVRNPKLMGGGGLLLATLLFGLIAPLLFDYGPRERGIGPANLAPGGEFWLGTTTFGQDVFLQFAAGIRSTFLVATLAALVSAVIGMTAGFVAGYLGGKTDEVLMMVTNVFLVIPVLVVLIVVTAYVGVNNYYVQALIVGLFNWPWLARAVRAQTLTLRSRDYVDLARLTGVRTLSIIRKDIAPNMASYLVMAFILLFAGSVLAAASLDFLGLGPRDGMSLGLMLNQATQWSALHLGYWWWFIPPGAGITLITGSAYVANVGMDEVFNPKLREM